MKAFLSYSIDDNDEVVIPMIADKLRKKGFFVTNGSISPGQSGINAWTQHGIDTSDLFIGLLTTDGTSDEKVHKEWDYSINKGRASVLLVEDGYAGHVKNGKANANVIKFNRHKPEGAIEKIRKKIEWSKNADGTVTELMPWIFGGTILIKLLTYLSRRRKTAEAL